jgi:hypothetical protein
MEMQQIIGMLAKMQERMDASQAKADAHQAKTQERMDANTKAMQEYQAKSDSDRKDDKKERKADKEEMLAEIKSGQAEMRAIIKAWSSDLKIIGEETTACQETMDARLEVKEPAPVDMTPEVADDQEVPVEDAVEMPTGEPKKRRRDGRNLAAVRRHKKKDRVLDARCHRREQERAQRKNGCLKNLVAARRGTTCRAVVARRRILFTETTRSRLIIAVRKATRRAQVARHNFLSTEETSREFRGSRKGSVAAHRGTTRHAEAARRKEFAIGRNHTCDKIGRGTRRLWGLRKRFWTRQIGRTGPEDLRGGSCVAPQNIKDWTLWRGRPPPKRKK